MFNKKSYQGSYTYRYKNSATASETQVSISWYEERVLAADESHGFTKQLSINRNQFIYKHMCPILTPLKAMAKYFYGVKEIMMVPKRIQKEIAVGWFIICFLEIVM